MTHLDQQISEEMKDTIFDASLDYFMNYLMSSDDLEDLLVDIYLSEIDIGHSDEGEIIAKAILEGISDYQKYKLEADKNMDNYMLTMIQNMKNLYTEDQYISIFHLLYQVFHESSLDVGSVIDNEIPDDINQLSLQTCYLLKESELIEKQFACSAQTLLQKLLLLKEINQTENISEPIIYDYIPSIEALEAILSMNAYAYIMNNELTELSCDMLAKNLGILSCNEYDQYQLVRNTLFEKDYLGYTKDSDEYVLAVEKDKLSLSLITIWQLILIFGNNCEYCMTCEPEFFYCIICDIFLSLSQAVGEI
ncbi:MAG: hypothetical protein LUH02_00850 [Erysipelotrichaceae bacterium]|nr:hypothetical protein [Erysipelotrichaceae bacterium]